MLSVLEIQNFGIIENSRMEFQSGFHVLSGETGAGKSILFEALNFVLGARADADCLRSGTAEAVVTAIFEGDLSPDLQVRLAEFGVVREDPSDPILLRRTLNAQGRSRGFINDISVTLKSLQQVGRWCVQHIGQEASRELTENQFLYRVLDQYGKNTNLFLEYTEAYREFQIRRQDLQNLKDRIEKSREQEEFLRFQAQELKEAKLFEGEEEELTQLKGRMKHRVALAGLTYDVLQGLSEGEGAILNNLGRILQTTEKAVKLDSGLEPLVTSLQEAVGQLEAADQCLQAYVNDLDEEPESLDPIENRLAFLHELKRKYRLDVSGLIEKSVLVEKQLGELEDFDSRLEEKNLALQQADKRLVGAAKKLNSARIKAGEKWIGQMNQSLHDLALPHTQMEWKLTLKNGVEDYHEFGGEDLAFLVSFNPGEEMRPFQEVLSGGELSRLLLALYDVLFPAKGSITLLFDEVDTGVGGKVAELMGRMLKNLSQKTQVLCITHLPQIASLANWQYVVVKEVRKGRTFSQIRCLKSEERVLEIARMLAGVEITEQALTHAKALLRNSAA